MRITARSEYLSNLTKQFPLALEYWGRILPKETRFTLVEYKQGDEIANHSGFTDIKFDFPLGIILNGRAEIYEIFLVNGFFRNRKANSSEKLAAYRPIRILGPGELFGDFAVIDKCLKLQQTSIQGENWKICSGYKAFWLIGPFRKNKKEFLHLFQNFKGNILVDDDIHVHRFFDKNIDSKTYIAFFNGDFINKNDMFFYELLKYSWPRVKIYRDCINSLNYRSKQDFISFALNKIQHIDKSKTKYSPKNDKTLLQHLFLEALWDACNRPIRREPMYSYQEIPYIQNNELDLFGIIPNNIFTSSYDSKESWFPIDFTNYIISSQFISGKTSESIDIIKSSDLVSNFSKHQQIENSSSSREFYKDLANSLLMEYHFFQSDEYGFQVKCIVLPGLGRDHLALHFVKK